MDKAPYFNEEMTLTRVTTVTFSVRSGLTEDKTVIYYSSLL